MTPRGGRRPSRATTAPAVMLWTPLALSRWAAAVAIGLVAFVTSWYQVSGDATWDQQVAPVNVALLSALLVNGAGIALLLAGRRAIGIRRLALLGEPAAVSTPHAAAVMAVGDELVSGPTRYHRADCSMVAGKSFPSATRSEHERAGRSACGVCRP